MSRSSFLVPEVLQTSGMDCGPASLACLLRAEGLNVSYPRIRDLGQTDVDGTSIDALEEVAISLGASAEQVVVPAHHVLEHETRAFPSLVVSLLPNGNTHFIVLWNQVGPWVQVMDPAVGRRWIRKNQLDELLYKIEVDVEEEDWLEWASGDEFLAPLKRRLARLAGDDAAKRWLTNLPEDNGARALANLDAAASLAGELVSASTLKQGARCEEFIDAMLAAPETIPESHQILPEREGQLFYRGCVLLRLGAELDGEEEAAELSEESRSELFEPPVPFMRTLWGLASASGNTVALLITLSALVGAMAVAFEALLFRALLDISRWLPLTAYQLGAIGALAALGLALLLIDLFEGRATRRIGRDLEIRFRTRLLEKLPNIPDPYFRSRLASDMADRGHHVDRLRRLPLLVVRGLRSTVQLLATATALTIIAPHAAWAAWLATIGGVAICLIVLRPLEERDLRVRAHSGSLVRFYLDGLLGLSVLRSHGAERLFASQHETLLSSWGRVHQSRHRLELVVELVVALWGLGAATLILYVHMATSGIGAELLLVAWWALSIPALTYSMAIAVRQLPPIRSATMMLLELFNAADLGARSAAPEGKVEDSGPTEDGTTLSYQDVSVLGGGQPVLRNVNVEIEAGEHIAIVGMSGAGKSSFLAVLLGIHDLAGGEVLVDGRRLDGHELEKLRQRSVWVAPEVALWNESLLDNLMYGHQSSRNIGDLLVASDLQELTAALPDGLNTPLGEGGRSVSGGEGQRVRVGRGLASEEVNLVVLDEAFRGLDRGARAALVSEVRERFAKATLLFATHDLEETAAFSRVLVFHDGELVEDGAPADLGADNDTVYSKLLAQERDLRERIWESTSFRQWNMEAGILRTESQSEAT